MRHEFAPDWIISPGEYLSSWADGEGRSIQEVAALLDLSTGKVDLLLQNELRVDNNLADRLAGMTNAPAALWLKLDKLFWEAK